MGFEWMIYEGITINANSMLCHMCSWDNFVIPSIEGTTCITPGNGYKSITKPIKGLFVAYTESLPALSLFALSWFCRPCEGRRRRWAAEACQSTLQSYRHKPWEPLHFPACKSLGGGRRDRRGNDERTTKAYCQYFTWLTGFWELQLRCFS